MEVLLIIPARKNSKGIPNKNITPLLNKPLISWSITEANKSNYVSRVIVSTDGEEIRNVSLNYGAEVIKRPDELSNDTATSESALLHALKYLKEKENYVPDILVFMQCTSPLTKALDIDNAIEKLLNENADSATTVTDFHYFIWQETGNGAKGINHDKNVRLRRQDREKQYLETGSVYVMKTDGFLQNQHRFFGKTVISYMPPERVVEIDEPVDVSIAESMFQKQLKKEKTKAIPSKLDVVLFDFDGVMTDDSVFVDETGKETVRCNRGDGMGISLLKKAGIKAAVLSTEANPVVAARCKKLKIECFYNLGHNKLESMKRYFSNNSLSPENSIYMGNDINDLDCMHYAGCAVAPRNASEKVKKEADIIIEKFGGEGAVRELCDLILMKKEKA